MYIEKLLIHELAEQAGTTVRTIRYYTEEGLLPEPEFQGKYAFYNRGHLDRLALIRHMKEAYLPLREIRQLMASLSDDDVQKRLREQPEPRTKIANEPNSVRTEEQSGASALEYISRLMGEQAGHRPQGQSQSQAPVRQQRSLSDSISAGENWQHILIADGLELHLRQPANPDQERKVRQLLSFAKTLFPKP